MHTKQRKARAYFLTQPTQALQEKYLIFR